MRLMAIIACVAGVGFAVAIHAAFHHEGLLFPKRVAFGDRAVTALTFRARLHIHERSWKRKDGSIAHVVITQLVCDIPSHSLNDKKMIEMAAFEEFGLLGRELSHAKDYP
jgi:hypothetical protein